MKIGNKIGINEKVWKGTKEDFEKKVKGKLPIGLTIDKAWEQFSKALPNVKKDSKPSK